MNYGATVSYNSDSGDNDFESRVSIDKMVHSYTIDRE